MVVCVFNVRGGTGTIEDSRPGCLFFCRVNFGNCSKHKGPSHI
jgi:hypothetical protein